MKKFWEWKNQTKDSPVGRTIFLNGTIADESWFDDDVTPQLFKDELMSGEGDVTVWINSPGGDCIAAAQIYNMLKEYPGNITVKEDGLAASAASVIAMAGDTVLMSPVSMMMIHNPATIARGDHTVMQQVIDMLDEVKESIINAYVIKSGQSRAKLSHLMDMETWLSAYKAVELGLADGILGGETGKPEGEQEPKASMFSRRIVNNVLLNKITAKYGENQTPAKQAQIPKPQDMGVSVDRQRDRLDVIEKLI